VCDDVEPDVPDNVVTSITSGCRTMGADLIIAIGGGSVIDTAKAVGLLLSNPGALTDYVGFDRVGHPLPNFYVVPTTAGCGSESSQFCVVLDAQRHRKMEIISRLLIPHMIFIDPALMRTMPAELTAGSGVNALTNAIEAYGSTWASPLTDALALHAIRLIFGTLRAAVADGDNPDARQQMAMAAFQAGLAFNNAQCGAVHALGHPLAGLLHVPERLGKAILLPHVMRFNLNVDMERMAKLAVAMGEPVEGLSLRAAAERAIVAVQTLLEDIGMPSSLDEVGVGRQSIPELTRQAVRDNFLRTNPRTLGPKEIESIYAHAFEHDATTGWGARS